ncbi:MAG: TIGR04086 family membrane protein [Actinobacteria bacterium]|nr:TIGR04086 family membrane protein [Actinomycetota bacterium]
MRRQRAVENRRDRLELAQEAGLGSASFVSILAGVLVAYGAFAVIAAIVGAVLGAIGFDTTEIGTNDWRQLGIGSGIAVGLSLFLAYLFGGYVAGRMARRAGAVNGLLVFVLGILVAGGIGAAIGVQADTDALTANLRSIGVPTTASEWSAIGTAAGLGALVAMLLGALGGGLAGERWHGKLMARALDPTVGTTAAATATTSDAHTSDDTGTVDLREREQEPGRTGRDGDETLISRPETTDDADSSRTRTMR